MKTNNTKTDTFLYLIIQNTLRILRKQIVVSFCLLSVFCWMGSASAQENNKQATDTVIASAGDIPVKTSKQEVTINCSMLDAGNFPEHFTRVMTLTVPVLKLKKADEVDVYITKIDLKNQFRGFPGTLLGRDGRLPQLGDIYAKNSTKIDKNGNIYIYDFNNGRIQKFSPDGKYLKSMEFDNPLEITYKKTGALETCGHYKTAFTIKDDGSKIYVYDVCDQSTEVLDENGNFIKRVSADEMAKENEIALNDLMMEKSNSSGMPREDMEWTPVSARLKINNLYIAILKEGYDVNNPGITNISPYMENKDSKGNIYICFTRITLKPKITEEIFVVKVSKKGKIMACLNISKIDNYHDAAAEGRFYSCFVDLNGNLYVELKDGCSQGNNYKDYICAGSYKLIKFAIK